jgi:hypothetical protein
VRPAVWIVGGLSRAPGLVEALRGVGLEVSDSSGERVAALAEATYGGRGLVLLDAADPAGAALLARPHLPALPVLALAGEAEALPPGVLRLVAGRPADELAHHVAEVVNEPRNLRRQPRVRVDLAASVGSTPARARDVSLYGLLLSPGPDLAPGTPVEVAVRLEDGAAVTLDGRVVARRGDGLAVGCRPCTDHDLVLWLHLILGGLERSPIHADVDPFDFFA